MLITRGRTGASHMWQSFKVSLTPSISFSVVLASFLISFKSLILSGEALISDNKQFYILFYMQQHIGQFIRLIKTNQKLTVRF